MNTKKLSGHTLCPISDDFKKFKQPSIPKVSLPMSQNEQVEFLQHSFAEEPQYNHHKFTAAVLTSLLSVSWSYWLLYCGGKKVQLLPTPVGVCPARWGPSAHKTQTQGGGVFSSWTPPEGWPDSRVSAAAGTARPYGQLVTKVCDGQTLSCLETACVFLAASSLFCSLQEQNVLLCIWCMSM